LKLSEMRSLLTSRGIQLTKSLGQNFLHDANQLNKIVDRAELASSNRILEIGPGLGPLTELLLNSGAHVLAIEKDRRLVAVLRERFHDRVNLELLEADALEYLKANRRDWSDWKLVSNLPYSVASPILVELALAPQPPERLVATLQLEVVERIATGPGTKSYGQLSLFLQLRYETRDWFKIPAGSFFPPPDVDSACVLLFRREHELLPAELVPTFVAIVKRAFSERRKVMSKLLRQDWQKERVTAGLLHCGVTEQARAETVTLLQFVELTKTLAA
jgi:16S rRNA (adenine1518-N6/adenine1519-N6)-dimethyltransferase